MQLYFSYLFSTFNPSYLCVSSSWASEVALAVKNPPVRAGDAGPIPGSGRSPGGGHGNVLQYSLSALPPSRVWEAHGWHNWLQDPGFCVWPCLGPGLMGEARPAPGTCKVQGVRGLGDSSLTHFSPGYQDVIREGPSPMVPVFNPQSPLCPVSAGQRAVT